MRKLPEIEDLTVELMNVNNLSESRKRLELIALIKDYFGEHDARIVLSIALYFKHPSQFNWLQKVLKKELEE